MQKSRETKNLPVWEDFFVFTAKCEGDKGRGKDIFKKCHNFC